MFICGWCLKQASRSINKCWISSRKQFRSAAKSNGRAISSIFTRTHNPSGEDEQLLECDGYDVALVVLSIGGQRRDSTDLLATVTSSPKQITKRRHGRRTPKMSHFITPTFKWELSF